MASQVWDVWDGKACRAFSVTVQTTFSVVRLQTLEKQKGIEVLKEACVACGEAIAAQKGRMVVKDEARVVRWPASPVGTKTQHRFCPHAWRGCAGAGLRARGLAGMDAGATAAAWPLLHAPLMPPPAAVLHGQLPEQLRKAVGLTPLAHTQDGSGQVPDGNLARHMGGCV